MSENEKQFCEYFEREILPNRNKVNATHVSIAGALIGKSYVTSCGSCLHNSAVDLLNYYNRILPVWNEFKKQLIAEPKTEKIVESGEPEVGRNEYGEFGTEKIAERLSNLTPESLDELKAIVKKPKK